MPKGLAEIAREALELSPRQRLVLARLLLESADETPDEDAAAAWDEEIRARIAAVAEGRAVGVPLEGIMRQADALLGREG